MKRYPTIKRIMDSLEESDIAIFAGEDLCREAYTLHREGNLYITDVEGIALSMAIGMAVTNTRRVFVFCEDEIFLGNISSIVQLVVSKCKNIFFVLLVSGKYQSADNQPTIYESISSVMGMLFNMGCIVHKITHLLNDKHILKETMKNLIGPLVIMFYIEKGGKKIDNVDILKLNDFESFVRFINDKEMDVYTFEPDIIGG